MPQFQKPQFNLCAQCGVTLVAPIWVEHLDERRVRNLWSCEACGTTSRAPCSVLDTAGIRSPTALTSALVH